MLKLSTSLCIAAVSASETSFEEVYMSQDSEVRNLMINALEDFSMEEDFSLDESVYFA